MLRRVNDWIALRATAVFGTMWAFYLCFLYGFAPLVWPAHQADFLYWSGWVQLWALPLLMVGGIVQGRAAEQRADEDHRRIAAMFDQQHAEIAVLHDLVEDVHAVAAAVHAKVHE